MSSNRIIRYNPNKEFNNLIPLENLSISVELTATKKDRSTIVNNTLVNVGNVNNVVRFISGSDMVGNQPSLTTKYTETGFGTDNLEGFGITEINIDFNTAYAPVIKINFIDVRGGMMERGNESKYRIFFDLPYPLYNLTIKGYYGKAVSYCLHMVKWNALFNSSTGNFEIEADFIGYTYAMLTDILVGYMKAIPYTTIGAQKFNELKNEFEGGGSGLNVLTLDEIIQKTEEVSELIEKFSKDTDEYKKLIAMKKSREIISKIKSNRQEFITNINNKSEILKPFKPTENIVVFMNTSRSDVDDYLSKYENNLSTLLDDLEEVADNINRESFTNIKKIRDIKHSDLLNVNRREILTALNDKSGSAYDIDDTSRLGDEYRLISILNTIQKRENAPTMITGSTTQPLLSDGTIDINASPSLPEFSVYDLHSLTFAINETIIVTDRREKEEKSKLSKVLRTKSKIEKDFDPNLNTIFLSLCTHAEAFMESVAEVARSTENNELRTGTLKSILNTSRTANISNNDLNLDIIHPFPEYYEGGTEKWMGNIVDSNSVPELAFTKELFNGLIESKAKEIYSEELNNVRMDWYAMSPTETPLMGNTNNPYRTIAKHPDELLRILMYRSFLYLSIYRPDITQEEIKVIATFEAFNMFYGNAQGVSYGSSDKTIRASLNEFFGGAANGVIEHFKTGSNNIKNYQFKVGEGASPYIRETADNYEYAYIEDARQPFRQYIPVSSGFNGGDFISSPGFIKSYDELKAAPIIFVGNAKNNQRPDDGASYVTILDFSKYDSTQFNKPVDREFDGEYYEDNSSKLGEKIPTEDSIKNSGKELGNVIKNIPQNFITTKFGTSEFLNINSNDDVRKYFFVDNQKNNSDTHYRGTTIKDLKDDKRDGKTYSLISEEAESYIDHPSYTLAYKTSLLSTPIIENISLFGSPLYYSQTNLQSKAYLFLSTLPLTGTYDQNTTNNTIFGGNHDTATLSGLFTGSGGIIKVPSVWVYWVGALLWRYYEPIDPIKKLPNGLSTIPLSTEFPSKGQIFRKLRDGGVTLKVEYPDEPYKGAMHLSSENIAGSFKFVDQTLLNLPVQVRNEFIQSFKTFAATNFKKIDEDLRIFDTSDISNFTTSQVTALTTSRLRERGIDTEYYLDSENTKQISNETGSDYFIYGVKLNVKNGVGLDKAKSLVALMRQSSIIINSTPRVFKADVTERISVEKSKMVTFLDTVASVYKNLYDKTEEKLTDEKKVINSVFGSDQNDEILLSIYRHLTAINDKWSSNDNLENGVFFPCRFNEADDKTYRNGNTLSGKGRLFDSFRFINKAFLDIGNDFLINPKVLSEMITSKYNQTFYDLISRVLSANNIDFIPLPSFVNFKTESGLKAIFDPITYNELISNTENHTIGPAFICVYVGQVSTALDIKDGRYPNDGTDLSLEREQELLCDDWNVESNDGVHRMSIPVFEVNYAEQNQSYFKDFKPDQREFVETQESLEVIDSLSKSGDKNKPTLMGQNLFNVYQKRSYSVEIDALGMPLIQPMMYFQLNDVPMFRGAYLIINTKHHIKPNHMTTKFKGVRVKNACTPLTEEFFLLKDLMLDLESDSEGIKYDLNNSFGSSNLVRVDNGRVSTGGAIINTDEGSGDIYNKNLEYKTNELITFDMVSLLNKNSNTKRNGQPMKYIDIFTEVANKFGMPISTVASFAYIESGIGRNKGDRVFDENNKGQMNKFGFMGLMQFGKSAAYEVKSLVSEYIFKTGTEGIGYDGSNYTFYAEVDLAKKQIKLPSVWKKNKSGLNEVDGVQTTIINNKSTNSLYDDYISTVAAIYYAITNVGRNDIQSKDWLLKAYLSHQQGVGGYNRLISNPTNDFNFNITESDSDLNQFKKNIKGNIPTKPTSNINNVVKYQDFILAWSGQIDAIYAKIEGASNELIA